MDEERLEELRERIRGEVRACLEERDDWLLVHLSKKEDGSVSLGPDTEFHGFKDSSELRGPRWRTLENAREFVDQGFKWVVAGQLSAWVLFRQLATGNIPRGVIMHARAVKRWAPGCAEPKPALNSVRGLIPRGMGGATEEENLLPVCRPCHDDIHNGKVDVSRFVNEVFVKRVQDIISAVSAAGE